MACLRIKCNINVEKYILCHLPNAVKLPTKKLMWCQQRDQLKVDFLDKCHQAKKIPKFLSLKIPAHLRKYDDAFKKGQLLSLKRALIQSRVDFQKSAANFEMHESYIKETFSEYFVVALLEWSKNILQTQYLDMKERHLRKLKNLNATDPFERFSVKNTVINLTNTQLSKMQKDALSLGCLLYTSDAADE